MKNWRIPGRAADGGSRSSASSAGSAAQSGDGGASPYLLGGLALALVGLSLVGVFVLGRRASRTRTRPQDRAHRSPTWGKPDVPARRVQARAMPMSRMPRSPDRQALVAEDEMPNVGRRSRELVEGDFPEITWEHSHVVVDGEGTVRTFCVYGAPNEEIVLELQATRRPHDRRATKSRGMSRPRTSLQSSRVRGGVRRRRGTSPSPRARC